MNKYEKGNCLVHNDRIYEINDVYDIDLWVVSVLNKQGFFVRLNYVNRLEDLTIYESVAYVKLNKPELFL